MALSDRVALLRAGLLEQVAPPREIYGGPDTAYAAQFIGQTNLLRAEVTDGIASAGSIVWRTFGVSGTATYSLRPECIRFANETAGIPSADADVSTARFRGRIRNQSFGGAMDLIEIDCGDAHVIRARIANPGILSGEREFEFAANDAVRLREGEDT